MAGESGESKLLTAESCKKLHTALADNDDYALGWMVLKRRWAVERMGGKTGVESDGKNGSRFWIELRAADGA